jgi:hypothetical protein
MEDRGPDSRVAFGGVVPAYPMIRAASLFANWENFELSLGENL